jgi:hypothetical protein
MAKFLMAYHGGRAPDTPEEGAEVADAWEAWFASMGRAVVDGGNPVGRAKTVASDGGVSEGGGPNPVSGYSVIEADSLDAAVVLAHNCPVLASGGSVEVAETFNAM